MDAHHYQILSSILNDSLGRHDEATRKFIKTWFAQCISVWKQGPYRTVPYRTVPIVSRNKNRNDMYIRYIYIYIYSLSLSWQMVYMSYRIYLSIYIYLVEMKVVELLWSDLSFWVELFSFHCIAFIIRTLRNTRHYTLLYTSVVLCYSLY